jgi:hypothetical protein
VFQGFMKAANRDEGRRTKLMMSAMRAAQANDKQFKSLWKELGDGNR